MDFIQGGTAFLGLLFATILSGLALWGRIARWLNAYEADREARWKQMVVDAITEQGLIKEGKPQEVWPNGSDNMIDFLHVLWKAMEGTQAELRALREGSKDDPK